MLNLIPGIHFSPTVNQRIQGGERDGTLNNSYYKNIILSSDIPFFPPCDDFSVWKENPRVNLDTITVNTNKNHIYVCILKNRNSSHLYYEVPTKSCTTPIQDEASAQGGW